MTGPATAAPTAVAGPPDLCQCGHDETAHPGPTGRPRHGICTTCGYSRQGAPTGFCWGWAPPTTPAGPPDLQQAIHAGTVALRDQHPAIGLSDPWAKVAHIAVEAAAPVLLQATRDRHADLEMQVAELRDLLEQSISTPDYDSDGQCNYCRMDIQRISRHSHCWQCGLTGGQHLDDCRIDAALQTSGHARGHTIPPGEPAAAGSAHGCRIPAPRGRPRTGGTAGGRPVTLQEALRRMDDLNELDRTAVWPGGHIPQWVLDDMAAKGVSESSVAPVLWAIHSWPDIARALRAALDQAAQREVDDKPPPPPCPIKGCDLPHEDIR